MKLVKRRGKKLQETRYQGIKDPHLHCRANGDTRLVTVTISCGGEWVFDREGEYAFIEIYKKKKKHLKLDRREFGTKRER